MAAGVASPMLRVTALGALGGLAAGPLVLLAVTSVAHHWYWPALVPPQWSLRAWAYLATPGAGVIEAAATSAILGTVVAGTAVAMALPAARALAARHVRGRRVVLFGLLLPVLAPPLAAAMGLHSVFLRLGLTDSHLGVALVHLVPAVPYATLVLAGSVANFDTDLEAQARTLGARPAQVWWHVILPAVAPGLAVAGIFAFLISWSQYLLTLIVGGGRVLTLPLLLVGFVRGGDEAVGAALSLVFIAPPLVLFAGVARLLREFR
ncbi:MAG: ABC transporter permease subunit [Acidobacteriota bacterium]